MASTAEVRQLERLLPQQRKALAHVAQLASRSGARTRDDAIRIVARAGLREVAYEEALSSLRRRARIALHFHPERLDGAGRSVAEGLLRDGVYRSQFETALSSGSPSAFPGGERDAWEERLFGGAYHAAGGAASDRPRYGALDVARHPDGPAPRFGSCYFLLRPHVSVRSTFTFGDSHEDGATARTGTLDQLDPVMASLLERVERGRGAFALQDLTVAGLLHRLTHELAAPLRDPGTGRPGRALDSYIEVQVHGAIDLAEDVERLVADPAFRDHPVGGTLAGISARFDVPLDWHPGFTLAVERVPEVFRGYPVRPLAERVAGRGLLDAANVGAEANSVRLEPGRWRDWAPHDDVLTQFRRLWHVLVLFGEPGRRRRPAPAGAARSGVGPR